MAVNYFPKNLKGTLSLLRVYEDIEESEKLKVIQFENNNSEMRIPEMFICEGEYRMITKLGHNCLNEIPFQKIIIPKTIREIEWSFYECINLQSIIVDKDNLHYCDIDGVLFDKDKKALLAYPNARIDDYHIPDSTTSIEHFAFKTCHLSGLFIPHSVTRIEANAFYGCRKLKHIYFEGRTLQEVREIFHAGFIGTEYGKMRVNPLCHTIDVETISLEMISETYH